MPTGKKPIVTKARAKKLTKKAPKNGKLEQSSMLVDKARIHPPFCDICMN
jgi:hypothetical protein